MAEPTEVVLTWSVTNWVTVTLMGLVGFALLGAAYKFFTRGGNGETN
jgi:hypothetical protein